jgi:ATP-dependent DNA helicase RecG
VLLKEPIMSEEQKLFEAQLGVHLSDQEAAVFAYACRQSAVGLVDVKAVIGGGNREAKQVLDRLTTQALLGEVEVGVRWEVAEHLKGSLRLTDQAGDQAAATQGDLVTDQPVHADRRLVIPRLTSLTDQQHRILDLCEVPRKLAELMGAFGLTHRTFFRRTHLEPLLQAGLIKMTYPQETTHPDQAYVITEAALGLLTLWKAEKK